MSTVVIWRRASKVVRPNPSLKRNTKSGPSYSASLLNFRPARFWYSLSSNVRPHILKAVPIVRENKTVEARCFCKIVNYQKKRPRSTSMSSRTQQIGPLGSKGNQEQRSYVPTQQLQASNYCFSFRSCPTKVIQARGWRFAPACCAA